MPVTKDNLHDVISSHNPDIEQMARMAIIREAAEEFAATILVNTPNCADQQAALRHVREALMTANSAVILRGAV
jgi:hypothetical protein